MSCSAVIRRASVRDAAARIGACAADQADTSWKHGPVLRLGRRYRFYYREEQGGGAAREAAVTVYPLPMYPLGGS